MHFPTAETQTSRCNLLQGAVMVVVEDVSLELGLDELLAEHAQVVRLFTLCEEGQHPAATLCPPPRAARRGCCRRRQA